LNFVKQRRVKGQIDQVIDDKILTPVSWSGQAHKYFLDRIGYRGKGEASWITDAHERKAIVKTEDRSARKQGSLIKIHPRGTVGVLKTSVLDGQIK